MQDKIDVKIVKLKMVREKSVKYNKSISHAEDVAKMVRPMIKDSYREMVLVVGVDNSNTPTMIHVVSYGSPNQSPVYPASVFKPLLLSNSSGFIIIHNHPGSTLSPSSADREITNRLKELGKLLDIEILDHIILNSDCTDLYSMRKHNQL